MSAERPCPVCGHGHHGNGSCATIEFSKIDFACPCKGAPVDIEYLPKMGPLEAVPLLGKR